MARSVSARNVFARQRTSLDIRQNYCVCGGGGGGGGGGT